MSNNINKHIYIITKKYKFIPVHTDDDDDDEAGTAG